MNARRVVVTGVGPVTPIGVGADAFWNGLLEKKCGIQRLEAFDPSGFDSQVGGEVRDLPKIAEFVPKNYRKQAKIMARDIELAVAAAWQAVMDAGLRTKCIVDRGDAEGGVNLDSTRFGANIGAGLISADLPEIAEAFYTSSVDGVFDIKKWGKEGMENLTPLWLLKFLPNMLACHVTIVHDAQGPSNTITCADASSHLAIGEAFRTIARGVADVCICGGAESRMNPMAFIRQSLGKRLTHRNDTPEAACRPFAADRDGTASAEGGGLVILEELEHAKARGARIYAELVGFGASNDAYTAGVPTKPHPEGRGVASATRKALKDAGVSADKVNLVVPMAAGLKDYDAAEALGLQTALGEHAAKCTVMAINGGVGSNGAGTGAIDFIGAVLAMHHNTIVPSLNTQPQDAALKLKINTSTTDAKIDYAITTAYAIGGGQNAALVLKAYR
ncbi:MAG: beta-ketoacyl synthase [Phycisphaerae bacterium]